MPIPKFQALTHKSNGGLLDRIITDISVTQAFDPVKHPSTPFAMEGTQALWDTGATRSLVSASLAAKLSLPNLGATKTKHAGGHGTSPLHAINLMLPNKVGFVGILATEFADTDGQFNVIVGMDVLALGDFALTHVNGTTRMSFRTPSMVIVDYVADHQRQLQASIGQNDPCYCGSGEKFKKCHRR